ncbi:hypothetical protein C380_08870 [Acidovorax sp. KKS102]|nr:hypothetical protein C380_08870 [Acidovorax sp. KKS102]
MRGYAVNFTLITHLIAAAVAAAAAWFYQGAQMDAAVAKLNATHAAQESERHRVALDDARATFRKGEIHARNQQEIADAHAAQEKRRLARLAAAAADGERLRKQVAEYAATCGGGETDSPAVVLQRCRDRAATLGVLYGEADSQAEAFAGAAEQHADEVRTLMRVIQNDRTLLPPAGGLGLKAPNRPDAGTTP